MNRFGVQAREHWREFLPDWYRQIPDPTEFFRLLGESAEQEIDELKDQLAGEPPEDEEYLEGVTRLETARFMAEAKVVREMILIDPEDELTIRQILG